MRFALIVITVLLSCSVSDAATVLRITSTECQRGRCVPRSWSGVCVAVDSNNSYVATVAHAFKTPQSRLAVEGRRAYLVGKTYVNTTDVALLGVPGRPFEADKVGKDPSTGDRIYASGFPGKRFSTTAGHVVRPGVISVRAHPGMSGGPVTDSGCIVGIIYGDDGRYGRFTPISHVMAIVRTVLRVEPPDADHTPLPPKFTPKKPSAAVLSRLNSLEHQNAEIVKALTALQETQWQLTQELATVVSTVMVKSGEMNQRIGALEASPSNDLTEVLVRLRKLEQRKIRVVVSKGGIVADDETFTGEQDDPIILDVGTKK